MTGHPMTVTEMDMAALCVARKRKFDSGREMKAAVDAGTMKLEGVACKQFEDMYAVEMDRIEAAQALSKELEKLPW
jgi:hypothetical protein